MRLEEFVEFKERVTKEGITFKGVNADTVYDTYATKIYPYLSLIGEFMSRERPASEKQIRRALGVGRVTWSKAKECFEDLVDYLGCSESFFNLKTELDLQKGLINTEYKNPKLQEMQQMMYNKEQYKPEKGDAEVVLPTVKIEFVDASISEEELEQQFPQDEEDVKE